MRCDNCKREGRDLQYHEIIWEEVSRKTRMKYFRILRRAGNYSLCQQCHNYIFHSNGNPKSKDYWPAMIYCFLISSAENDNIVSLSLAEKWAFIPFEWRNYWLAFIQQFDQSLQIDYPKPLFILGTRKLQKVTCAIESLDWRRISSILDKYLAYPTVRCPWGCSEFLHKSNSVPLEEFLAFKSNYMFNSYGRTSTHSWTTSTRPSFPDTEFILENPDFPCCPTIVLDEFKGACILCCGNHSIRSKERILHVPGSQCGTLFTPLSNQYSPVVLRPRTLRTMKKSLQSDTYTTALLTGNFAGIDSCYLTGAGHFGTSNALADKRNLISCHGRPDIQSYICQLSRNRHAKNYLPLRDAQNLLKRSEAISINEEQLQGSTFVPIEEAIALQKITFQVTRSTLLVTNATDQNGNIIAGHEELFDAPWPMQIIHVHPYDGYGEEFTAVKDKANSFLAFSLVAVISCCSDLWAITTASVSRSDDPQGYLLSLSLLSNLHLKKQAVSSRFSLKKATDVEICNFLRIDNESVTLSVEYRRFWENINKVDVVDGTWRGEEDENSDLAVIMMIDDENPLNDFAMEIISEEGNVWKAVCIIAKKFDNEVDNLNWNAIIYSRHKDSYFENGWWCQDTKKGRFRKARTIQLPVTSAPSIIVYVKTTGNTPMDEQRGEYLKLLGGQYDFFCGNHHCALVVNFDKTGPICSCNHEFSRWNEISERCTEKSAFVCAQTGCNVGICTSHVQEISQTLDKDSMFLLTRTTGEITERFDLTQHRDEENMENEINEGFEEMDEDYIQEDDSTCTSTSGNDSNINNVDEQSSASHIDIDELGNLEGEEMLYDNEDNTSEVSFDPNAKFLTSDSAAVPYELCLDAPREEWFAPLHVLLNQQGHCLVRQRNKLRMAKQNANFFQRVVSLTEGKSIPLVYAEALLFPDIFSFAVDDGSIIGALPTALWTDCHTLKSMNIASMKTHSQIRLFDPGTLCSTDSRYHFLSFDSLVNLGLRGNDSRLVLHRGFAEKQTSHEGVSIGQKNGRELYGDSVESHTNVYKLSALTNEYPPHYFYTQSCNQSSCPGLRKLRQWVTSEGAATLIAQKYGVTFEEAGTLLRESAASFIQRSWNVAIDLWMEYIVYSPDEPLHKIDYAWWRKEFQDQAGNVSHIHCILRTCIDMTTPHGTQLVLNKIRGCLSDIIHYNELVTLREDGYIDSLDILQDILQDAQRFLTHRCHARCQIPRTDENGQVTFVCKAPNNFLLSSTPNIHSFQDVKTQRLPDAERILVDLDFATEQVQNGHTSVTITHPYLKMHKHVPKSSKADGKFSPTNGKLFVQMRSSQNLQFITNHALGMYLTKYVTDIDKVAVVLIKSPKKNDPTAIKGEHKNLGNTKITSVRRLQEKETKKKDKKENKPLGRPITHMEALSVIEGNDLVTSTRRFIHMSTSPREYRAAVPVQKFSGRVKPEDLVGFRAVVGKTVRDEMNMNPSQNFTQSQVLIIQDEIEAPLRTDYTTLFSIRPPELRFIRSQKKYITWFERKPVCPIFSLEKCMEYLREHLSKQRFHESEWLDGFNYKVVIRKEAVEECLQYARICPLCHFGNGTDARSLRRKILHLLQRLLYLYQIFGLNMIARRLTNSSRQEWERLQETFLSSENGPLPVVYITPIFPRRKTAFLIQLLLAFGEYETEYDIMMGGSLRQSYCRSGLLDPEHPDQSLKLILSRYVMEILRSTPGSTYQFDRNLCQAKNLLQDFLFGNDYLTTPTPSVLFSHMKEECDNECDSFLEAEKQRLTDNVCNTLVRFGLGTHLPTIQDIMDARLAPLDIDAIRRFYPPERVEIQSPASHQEQAAVLQAAEIQIDRYLDPARSHKNMLIVGGPGVGKTTVSQIIMLRCLCSGFNGTSTSLVADRSKEIGGTHIHRLLSLRGFNKRQSPGRAAEQAIRDIYRRPQLLWFLKHIDFLFIDELGVVSGEMIAILDLVLRYVRQSSEYLGGLFVFCTLDHQQLTTFEGTHPLLSQYIINEFHFFKLKESVRAARDPALREICSLTRLSKWRNEDIERFRYLVGNHCHFVPTLDDPSIPSDAVYVFGRRAPCQESETIMIQRMKEIYRDEYTQSIAIDEESTTAGNWIAASTPTTTRINRKIKRRHTLTFFPKAKFEFTYIEQDRFSQGQLALFLQVPSQDSIERHQDIVAWKAPNGVKDFPPDDLCTEEYLLSQGWQQVRVPYSASPSKIVARGLQGRRSQYGLRPRIATTIHACMGCTLTALVTAVIPLKNSTQNFNLWDPAQVVVLMSRTEYASHFYFVGDKHETIEHLLNVLQQPHQYKDFITDLLDKLCSESSETTTTFQAYQANSFFRPRDTLIPRIPCVYLLVSTKNLNFFYIGETQNVAQRLLTHNTGKGPKQTQNPILMPWALVTYVTGFTNRQERKQFESTWKIFSRRNRSRSSTANGLISIAHELLLRHNTQQEHSQREKLRLVECGTIVRVSH